MAVASFVTDTEQCCQNFLWQFFQYMLIDCKIYHSESPVRYNEFIWGEYGGLEYPYQNYSEKPAGQHYWGFNRAYLALHS